MSKNHISRRSFAAATTAGLIATSTAGIVIGQDGDKKKPDATEQKPERYPEEAPFERDYDPPGFKPSWKKQQINRMMAQDFVIYAHSDLPKVKMLLEREPALLNATLDWGGGDWETALGGASHMGRRDIVEYLLANGARMDLFCAAMMGLLDSVKAMLTLEPTLIDAKGPHGFSLHFHARAGQEKSKHVLEYLQSIKEVAPHPRFLKKKKPGKAKGE